MLPFQTRGTLFLNKSVFTGSLGHRNPSNYLLNIPVTISNATQFSKLIENLIIQTTNMKEGSEQNTFISVPHIFCQSITKIHCRYKTKNEYSIALCHLSNTLSAKEIVLYSEYSK